LVIIIFIFYIALTPEPAPSFEEGITVNLSAPTVKPKEIDNETYWDLTFVIFKITHKDQEMLWKDVRLNIKAIDGRPIIMKDKLKSDDPSLYDIGLGPFVEVQCWYNDTPGTVGVVNPGDIIKVTGLPEELQGCTLELIKGGERIASATLPSEFS
jgi:hypothetical protein